MISQPAGTPEAAFKVEFGRYGIAPGGGVVIKVTKAQAEGESTDAAALAKKLAGANLVVRTSGGVDASTLKGGAYSGIVKTVADKDAYAFVLTAAEAR